MATRYTTIGTTLAALTAIGITIGTAADGPAVRSAIGAQEEVLTTNGDLVVRSGGATTRLGTSGAPDGGVLTVANGAPQWAAASGGSGPTTLYADDCVAENGSDTASISGSGASSTFTLTATTSSRTYGSGGSTASRIVCVLPAGTHEVTVEVGLTSVMNMNTGGYRSLIIALRNTADGAAPALLWGAAFPDQAGGVFYNNLLGGGNTGSPSSSTAHSPTSADKWFRVTLQPRVPFLSIQTGAGSGGARPTAWVAAPTPAPLQTNGSSITYPDMAVATAIAIVLGSHGSGVSSSITGTLAVRVVPQ